MPAKRLRLVENKKLNRNIGRNILLFMINFDSETEKNFLITSYNPEENE